jgi:hypothetical protein
MIHRCSAFIGVFGILILATLLLFLAGCARDQELTTITIQPQTEVFGATDIPVSANAGATVQLRAIGSYIHPPLTKDITTEVTWSSNTPSVATVDANGLLTATGDACGDSIVSATVTTKQSTGNIVTSSMTATVVCFTGETPSEPTLTVNFVNGTGRVTSSPAGIDCTSNCGATFPIGADITLTAAPSGTSTSTTWNSGCNSSDPTTCTVNDLTADRVVNVTFN